jgi:hypothetical protein
MRILQTVPERVYYDAEDFLVREKALTVHDMTALAQLRHRG